MYDEVQKLKEEDDKVYATTHNTSLLMICSRIGTVHWHTPRCYEILDVVMY